MRSDNVVCASWQQLARETSRLKSKKDSESAEIASALQREIALATVMRQRRLRQLEADLALRAEAEVLETKRYEEAIQAQEV